MTPSQMPVDPLHYASKRRECWLIISAYLTVSIQEGQEEEVASILLLLLSAFDQQVTEEFEGCQRVPLQLKVFLLLTYPHKSQVNPL